MLKRRSVAIGGLAVAAASLTRVATADGRPTLVFMGHEL
jgi:hypothetical protein